MRFLNNRGFTMAEAVISAAVLGVVTFALMTASSVLFKIEGDTENILDSNRVIIGVLENIRSDPALYQINFQPPSVSDDSLLQTASLPLAYKKGYFGDAAGCPECKVRLGFVIRPVQGNPGLFGITVRSVTTDDQGGTVVKDMYGMATSN